MKLEEMTLDITQHVDVKAAIGEAYKGVLYQFGEGNTTPDGKSLQMILEPWAGGRWFRDRGEGIAHLWGHVQVLKPPTLIEISGPMFMSYPAINHIEIKLEPVASATRISLRHRAIGMLDPEHKKGVSMGWGEMLEGIKRRFA